MNEQPKVGPTALGKVVLIIFVMAFVDTIGTLIGLSARAGLLDKDGNLPEIEKPMLADALANLADRLGLRAPLRKKKSK